MGDGPTNHLIVGLGGTGGKVLRSFRKTIVQNDGKDPANIQYLYVDSSDSMMGLDDPTWKLLGKSVQLPKASQLRITGINVNDVLDNINDHPGISPWIGNRDQLRQIVSSADAANIVGGQKRRMGRFLFACRVSEYLQQLGTLVSDMQTGNVTDVTFHFVCGLAGGTGSGSLPDAICQTRNKYPTANYRIIIYALLPDKNPAHYRAGANYHANGYAALTELNALDVGSYEPYDVSGKAKGRLKLQDPFNCCYLFADENEDHQRVDIDSELPDIVASFLYQKIIATRELLWKSDGDSIKRQERFELGSQADEKECSPGTGVPERTRRFFTFGVKQIVYPQEEIKEYLTYTFAAQGTFQLLFNNWSDSFGYLQEATNQTFGEVARKPENQQRWHIADNFLMLSSGILPEEKNNKKWKPIPNYWMDSMPHFKSVVEETASSENKLTELYRLFTAAFDTNYRDLGVRAFYDVKGKEISDHAKEVRSLIEADQFQSWKDGIVSIHDVKRTLDALLKVLEEKGPYLDDLAAKAAAAVKDSEARHVSNGREWTQTGPINALFGKRKRIFLAEALTLQSLFIARTNVEALRFARALLQAIVSEVTELSNQVSRTASTITACAKHLQEQAEIRCADDGRDVTKQVIRFYDPNTVRDFCKVLVKRQDIARRQTQAIRLALINFLGDSQSFSTFNAKVSREMFIDSATSTAERSVEEAHDDIINADKGRDKILGVSVIERLAREYDNATDQLRQYITDIVSRSKTFLGFNPAEVKRIVPGNESLGPMFSYSTIILPEAPERAEFRETLANEFKSATSDGQREIVANPKRGNEITLINVKSAFPARFVQDVLFLKERFDSLVSSNDGGQARFELFSEGDGTQFPSLFLRKLGPDDVLPLLLLGKSLNLIQELEDPKTGLKALYLLSTDKDGIEEPPRRVGANLADAINNVDNAAFDKLDNEVRKLLAGEYLHQAKREELYVGVQTFTAEVKAEHPNPLDETRRRYIEAEVVVKRMLNKDRN